MFRNVRMTPELMDLLFTRNEQGYRLRVDWGKPDAEGFYVPTITTDYTDRAGGEPCYCTNHAECSHCCDCHRAVPA